MTFICPPSLDGATATERLRRKEVAVLVSSSKILLLGHRLDLLPPERKTPLCRFVFGLMMYKDSSALAEPK